MSVILSADPTALADRRIQPMSRDQVAWFVDPVAFLHGVPHLWTLDLKVYCARCWTHGLTDDVTVTWRDLEGVWIVRCACAKVPARLSLADVVRYAHSTDELLHKLGWSLACRGRCATEPGIGDGVEARNDPQAQTLSIRCGCTDRRYVRDAA